MVKFRCIGCKKEFETDADASTKNCPFCFGRYLELISGEINGLWPLMRDIRLLMWQIFTGPSKQSI